MSFWTKYEILRMCLRNTHFRTVCNPGSWKILRNAGYMYEFETKSLLKIIFITFVIWNNCFLLQNDFFPLAHSLWQQKRCKGFSIKDSECWIFRENCKYCQKRLKCIIFHNFNSLLLPSKESRIRLLIPKCYAYNFSCFGFQS